MLLHNFLDFHARENGAFDCVIQGERTLSYAQMAERVNRLANAFVKANLGAGDRFALLSKNSIDMVVVYLAASKVGAVPVPLNWRLAPPEWAYIIHNAEAVLIIAEAEFCSAVDSIRGDIPAVIGAIAIGLKDSAKAWIDFDAWLEANPATVPQANIREDDVFYQVYTSGTTGRPKGAMLTHRSVLSNSVQCMPFLGAKLHPGKRALIVMPLFHAGGASTVFGSLVSGAAMVIHNDFSPQRLAEALSEHCINMVNLVPAMIQAMLINVPDLAERAYPDLEVIIYGASPIAEDTLRRAMDIFQCEFYQGYGQTESSAGLAFLTDKDHRRALESQPALLLSAGRAMVGTQLRIVDNTGHELPRGQVGEIIAHGPQLMKAYWKMPEANAATLIDGWLYTGDAAYMDEDGYIFIQDRIKDMVVSGGENIYPSEIENVLFDHPAIADAAVIGVPDVIYGEALLGILVLRDGEKLEAEEIISFCRGKLGGFKVPRLFKFVEDLPRNAGGKVLKKVLRAPYWTKSDRSIS